MSRDYNIKGTGSYRINTANYHKDF